MSCLLSISRVLTLALICAASSVAGQTTFATEQSEESFSPDNAILDTSIAFAVGAREGRQSLRGSFGWPSFQEGLVDGVYYRFDPDGYARFSPTPRLDLDVFEVICKPRTYTCYGRKDGLEVHLTGGGAVHLKISEVGSGDLFFTSDGASEIQVPERILQPLDLQLELLLASAGELSVRRGGNVIVQVSLKGFHAVASYLRWVMARQDYAVLPIGWPVPNSRQNDISVAPAPAGPLEALIPLDQVEALEVSDHISAEEIPDRPNYQNEEISLLREEIGSLKIILETTMAASETSADVQESSGGVAFSDKPELEGLLAAVEALQAQVDDLSKGQVGPDQRTSTDLSQGPIVEPSSNPDDVQAKTVQDLQYLMEELGLDLNTAVAIIQMGTGSQEQQLPIIGSQIEDPAEIAVGGVSQASREPDQGDIVDEILRELEEEMSLDSLETPPVDIHEYQLLSEYFKSAALPALRAFADAASENVIPPYPE